MDGVTQAAEQTASLVRVNLDTSYTDGEWGASWAGCSDPGALTFKGEVLENSTSCISFDGLATYRVVTPDHSVETAFASVLGINSFQSSCLARPVAEQNSAYGRPPPVKPLLRARDPSPATSVLSRWPSGGIPTWAPRTSPAISTRAIN